MPATPLSVQAKLAAMPMFGWFMSELGLQPRDALKRARAIFSELSPDAIERASSAFLAGDRTAWAESLPDQAWDGVMATFADAANPGGDAAGGLAWDHTHLHDHDGGLRHVHPHRHPGRTTQHCRGSRPR